MITIDADAHVIETEHTWDYLEPDARKYRPTLVAPGDGSRRERWLIDGKVAGFRFPSFTEKELEERSRRTGRDVRAPQAAREMDDIGLRLKEMDRLGIDIQVLHNTLFIEQLTDRPEVEVALCRAWNRWLADIWKQGRGRLFWSMVPPLLSIPDALDEIRIARENGAVAVLMRPIEGERVLVDPYFYPVYEEAERLDLAIAVHIGNANPTICNILRSPHDSGATFGLFRIPAVLACHSIIMSEIPQRFPRLRWGIIEASAQWVPWVIEETKERYHSQGKAFPENILEDCRIYVTCQTNDDIPYVVKHAGEQSIVIGTDYGHFDSSTEVDAITAFREASPVPPPVVDKILYDNPKALYGLTV
jgi:predicted TIM-barrel fold metal-dependent hydrolase